MIISFAWTTEALLAGRKTCTRRDWGPGYAAKFREGTVHDAYDRLPRVHGKKVGNIEIMKTPYPENTRDIPDSDFKAEGFAYMEEKGILMRGFSPREYFEAWRHSGQTLFVVRFALVFPCDRCGTFTRDERFGPKFDKRLCPQCWSDWSSYADNFAFYHSQKTLTLDGKKIVKEVTWEKCYNKFCATARPREGKDNVKGRKTRLPTVLPLSIS